MKKVLKYLLFFGVTPLLLMACPHDHGTSWKYRNLSDHPIMLSFKLEQFGGPCPDTSIRAESPGLTIEPGKYYHDINVDNTPMTCDTMRVFFLSVDTVVKYAWEEIRESYNILMRCDFTVDQINNIGYEITYPPSDAMKKNLKIYMNPNLK